MSGWSGDGLCSVMARVMRDPAAPSKSITVLDTSCGRLWYAHSIHSRPCRAGCRVVSSAGARGGGAPAHACARLVAAATGAAALATRAPGSRRGANSGGRAPVGGAYTCACSADARAIMSAAASRPNASMVLPSDPRRALPPLAGPAAADPAADPVRMPLVGGRAAAAAAEDGRALPPGGGLPPGAGGGAGVDGVTTSGAPALAPAPAGSGSAAARGHRSSAVNGGSSCNSFSAAIAASALSRRSRKVRGVRCHRAARTSRQRPAPANSGACDRRRKMSSVPSTSELSNDVTAVGAYTHSGGPPPLPAGGFGVGVGVADGGDSVSATCAAPRLRWYDSHRSSTASATLYTLLPASRASGFNTAASARCTRVRSASISFRSVGRLAPAARATASYTSAW